jgi:hypothetical protein
MQRMLTQQELCWGLLFAFLLQLGAGFKPLNDCAGVCRCSWLPLAQCQSWAREAH